MQELLSAAAAALNAPESLVSRSAAARAKATGSSVEDVLRAWTGGAAPPAATAPTPEPAAPEPAPAAEPAAPAASAAAGAAGPIDWAALAASQGMPEKLLRRSVEAKAKKSGQSVEAVVAEMTGQPVPTTGAAPAPTEPAAPVAPAAPEPAPAVVGAGPAVDVYEPAGPASEPAAGRAGDAAGEIRSDGIPRWLAAVFVIVPAFAVMYALFLPNGPSCGDAGRLAVDPVTGVAVNCDGSEYGVEVVDFFAVGQEVYAQCSSCHGANGGGGGNFPAFVDGALLTVFPEGACENHVEWVRVGTAGWPDPTYGANAKPVGGSGAVMPGFGSAISEEELRAVVLYERVRFGGLALDATLADCGLAEEPEPAG